MSVAVGCSRLRFLSQPLLPVQLFAQHLLVLTVIVIPPVQELVIGSAAEANRTQPLFHISGLSLSSVTIIVSIFPNVTNDASCT